MTGTMTDKLLKGRKKMYYKKRRSLSQLRAISYSYRAKQLMEQSTYLTEHELWEEYYASKYKTMTWFIKNYEKQQNELQKSK